jgi:hypothetical protein
VLGSLDGDREAVRDLVQLVMVEKKPDDRLFLFPNR